MADRADVQRPRRLVILERNASSLGVLSETTSLSVISTLGEILPCTPAFKISPFGRDDSRRSVTKYPVYDVSPVVGGSPDPAHALITFDYALRAGE